MSTSQTADYLIARHGLARNTRQTANYLAARHGLPLPSAVPSYAEGLALQSEEIDSIPAYQWPTHAAVPWPRGTVRGRYFRLGVFADGVEIPSQQTDAQSWDPHGVDLRWTHHHFVWQKGAQYAIKGVPADAPRPAPAHPVQIFPSGNTLTVETGKIRAVINKENFALLNELHFASAGAGVYDRQLLSGAEGAEILDNGTLFAARHHTSPDPQVETVTVEVEGPLYAVIKAQGKYQDNSQSGNDWADFTTRIHFWAGQEWIRVVHNLGYREDMASHTYDRAAIVMPFDFAQRFAYAADGQVYRVNFPSSGDDVFFHQMRHDAYRFGTDAELTNQNPRDTGTRSDNAWAIHGSATRVECYLRNGWQEFPFEVKAGPTGMGLSMQPWHGYEAFGQLTDAEHTSEPHIHKLRYAHTGPQQRQGLPTAYVDAFNAIDQNRNTDSEMPAGMDADVAASSNWQGMMLRQDFYLRIAADPAFDTDHLVDYARLVQRRPIAVPDPSHFQASQVFGPIGARSRGHAEVFDHVSDIVKGEYNPERGGYYGRFRWGALPHKWLIDADRPHWERLEYGDSHYDRIALIFWYYAATGDAELLQVGRKAVKFHQSFRYVNYLSSTSIPGHDGLMQQWHKGHAPCAGSTFDYDTNYTGHSIHAYSMLVGWLVDADLDLKEAYQRWSNEAEGEHDIIGRDREVNNNLHELIQRYEFFHQRQMKTVLKALAHALILEPMDTFVGQSRDWDQAWPLYLDLFGGTGVRAFFEREACRGQWLYEQSDKFAHMALCYRVTGDRAFLARALKPLRSKTLRQIFRPDPNGGTDRYRPGFYYDAYSQPEVHKALIHLLYYLQQAGITAIPEDDGEPGHYPSGNARPWHEDDPKKRGTWIPIHNPTGQSFTLQIRLGTFNSSNNVQEAGAQLYAPDGTELLANLSGTFFQYPGPDDPNAIPQHTRPSGWIEFPRQISIPSGPPGRYDLYIGVETSGQYLSTTAEDLLECAVIRNYYRDDPRDEHRTYRGALTRMYILPTTTNHQIDWVFAPRSGQHGCRVRVYDADDSLVHDKHMLIGEQGHESFTASMNGPGDPPTPWRIDCGPDYSLQAHSQEAANNRVQNLALVGPSLTDLREMLPRIPLFGDAQQ